MIYFREHRGTFDESMKTRFPFTSLKVLFRHISGVTGARGNPPITISVYGHDQRIPADTFIVTTQDGVVGFLDDGDGA